MLFLVAMFALLTSAAALDKMIEKAKGQGANGELSFRLRPRVPAPS